MKVLRLPHLQPVLSHIEGLLSHNKFTVVNELEASFLFFGYQPYRTLLSWEYLSCYLS